MCLCIVCLVLLVSIYIYNHIHMYIFIYHSIYVRSHFGSRSHVCRSDRRSLLQKLSSQVVGWGWLWTIALGRDPMWGMQQTSRVLSSGGALDNTHCVFVQPLFSFGIAWPQHTVESSGHFLAMMAALNAVISKERPSTHTGSHTQEGRFVASDERHIESFWWA